MNGLFELEGAQQASCAKVPELDTGIAGAGEDGDLVREATAGDVQIRDGEVVIGEGAVWRGVVFGAGDGGAGLVVGSQETCQTPDEDAGVF